MPRVSIIAGAYNCEDTLETAINSIIKQTYKDWECIICDDGSTDNTWEKLVNIAGCNNKFKLIKNKTNGGLAAALNKCISLASGEYLARQDMDDFSLEHRIEEQVEYLDKNKEVSVVGTYVSLIDENGLCCGEIRPPIKPQIRDWVKTVAIAHASVIMRKSDIIEVGKYNEKAIRVEDYDLWMRLVGKGYKIGSIPKVLYNVTWNDSNYQRRKFRHRLVEAKYRFIGYRSMEISPLYYIYILRPLVVGLIPMNFMKLYHRYLFRGV